MNRVLLFAAVTVLAGCFSSGIKVDGAIKSENRSIANFSEIVVTGAYKIKWSSGKPALTISTDQNLLPLISTSVTGNTLQIESTQDLRPTKGITISAPGIRYSLAWSWLTSEVRA